MTRPLALILTILNVMLNGTQWSEASREMFRFAQHDNQAFLQEVY